MYFFKILLLFSQITGLFGRFFAREAVGIEMFRKENLHISVRIRQETEDVGFIYRISNVYLSCIYRISIVYLSCIYRV